MCGLRIVVEVSRRLAIGIKAQMHDLVRAPAMNLSSILTEDRKVAFQGHYILLQVATTMKSAHCGK